MTIMDDLMGGLQQAEQRMQKYRMALLKIAETGQSLEPDHWKFREMARKVASEALKE